jgi:hypothetical protein
VKAGEALTKGQAVYVSSANGTNMIVSKASNGSEATSSKTMGLIDSTLSTNGISYVIAEGLLAGLNTSSATAGDAVWLGTSGNLIYGLASKPVAPAHLVFIGIVTRAHATQGEIFVKVQNGFELDELHNVLITSPADKQVLKYDAASSLWKNGVASGGVTASATAPASPNAGDAWFDSNDGTLYVWYVDTDGSQWVQVQANSALEGTILSRLGAVEARATVLETNPSISGTLTVAGTTTHNGKVLAPNQPAFQASNNPGTASNSVVAYSVSAINVNSCYNTSNGRFTAPIAGKYFFSWNQIGSTSNTVHRYHLIKNGTLLSNSPQLRLDSTATGTEYAFGSKSWILQLAANDYVSIYFQSDDGSVSFTDGGDYSGFTGYLLG